MCEQLERDVSVKRRCVEDVWTVLEEYLGPEFVSQREESCLCSGLLEDEDIIRKKRVRGSRIVE